MAVHDPATVYPAQQGSNRATTTTWGLPTKVANPGNANGNFPPVDPNDTGYPSTPWVALALGDTCNPLFCPAMTDRSIQISGTAGAAGSITIQGSNDGVNYVTLSDVFGSALSGLTPGVIVQVNQLCNWIKPVVIGGDGTTAMNVIMTGKKQF